MINKGKFENKNCLILDQNIEITEVDEDFDKFLRKGDEEALEKIDFFLSTVFNSVNISPNKNFY